MEEQDGVSEPIDEAFARRVRALLRRSEYVAREEERSKKEDMQQKEHHQFLVAGPLRIDVGGRRVMCREQEVELQNKQFDLLVYLVMKRGIVVTRDALLQHVWGYDYAGDTRTVDVHIRWLREKLEEDPANPILIQTVRGVGYVFR